MNNYEKLLDVAENDGITVTEDFDLSQTRFKGLYCDGLIAINQEIETNAERTGILAEELGHHYTTVGDITNQMSIEDRKQERRARIWAYNKLIGLRGILSAYKANCLTLNQMAEHLEVSEEFLSEALDCYRTKYGPC
ncbi:MAG: ImmA/IrrE family metallo-endopeptidase, partial [Acetivibrio ethanolgignens]